MLDVTKYKILIAERCSSVVDKGNVLFNVTLNTFYMVIWHPTYGKGQL